MPFSCPARKETALADIIVEMFQAPIPVEMLSKVIKSSQSLNTIIYLLLNLRS